MSATNPANCRRYGDPNGLWVMLGISREAGRNRYTVIGASGKVILDFIIKDNGCRVVSRGERSKE